MGRKTCMSATSGADSVLPYFLTILLCHLTAMHWHFFATWQADFATNCDSWVCECNKLCPTTNEMITSGCACDKMCNVRQITTLSSPKLTVIFPVAFCGIEWFDQSLHDHLFVWMKFRDMELGVLSNEWIFRISHVTFVCNVWWYVLLLQRINKQTKLVQSGYHKQFLLVFFVYVNTFNTFHEE